MKGQLVKDKTNWDSRIVDKYEITVEAGCFRVYTKSKGGLVRRSIHDPGDVGMFIESIDNQAVIRGHVDIYHSYTGAAFWCDLNEYEKLNLACLKNVFPLRALKRISQFLLV